jgi:hypothetical protein
MILVGCAPQADSSTIINRESSIINPRSPPTTASVVVLALLLRARWSLVLDGGRLRILVRRGVLLVELALLLLFLLAFLLDFPPALLERVLVFRQNGLLLRIFPTHK